MEYLERITPTEAGIRPEAIEGFLRQVEEKKIHLHNFRMIKGDKVFAEGSYAPCEEKDLHILYSLSKSFTSTAIGFAVQEGLLSLDDKMVDFFEEELKGKKVSENTKKITIRHLLTMNSGKHQAEDEIYTRMQDDWIMNYLCSPVEHEPGSWFLYDDRAVFMEAVILERLTGEHVYDYLKTRLFDPLGCSEQIWWEKSPTGYNIGAFGLSMPIEDVAKFGVFVKNKGMWKGRQLLNRAWFEEASNMWSDTSVTWQGESAYGYGYHFWGCHVPGTFRGDGAFGQYCVILPEEDMVFVTNAGELDMQRIIDAFWENVYPKTAHEIPEEAGSEEEKVKRLTEHEQRLKLPAYYEEKLIDTGRTEADLAQLDLAEEVKGKRYRLGENYIHISSIRFLETDRKERIGKECRMELGNGRSRDTFYVAADRWTKVLLHLDSNETNVLQTGFRQGMFEDAYVKGCTVDGTLYLDLFFYHTTAQDTWEVRFWDDRVSVKINRNTCFVPINGVAEGVAE